jgi:hypothetical protein
MRLALLLGRGDAEARRKEYTQHLVDHLDLLLAELAAERQRFAAPLPPGTPGGGDAPPERRQEGGCSLGEENKDTADVPLAAEWVTVDIKRMCSEYVSQHASRLRVTSDSPQIDV